MDTAKHIISKVTGDDSAGKESASKGVYEKGFSAPVSTQDSVPGKQGDMPGPPPKNHELPTPSGGATPYLAAGKLANRKALITGGDSGIGRAVAVLYAMEGATSTIAYLPAEEDDAQATAKEVRAMGGAIHLVAADLRDSSACKRIVEQAVTLMGGLDIVVLNHGTQMMQESITDVTDEQWLNTFNTNIHPFFFISKAAVPHLKPGSAIITCASVNPYVGREDLLDYTSTKGAIVAFTRGLSNQQIGNGIRVNCVCPGPIWTPLIPATMSKEAQKQFTSPMGRPGQPAEVATCFVFLASADSSFMSGQSLHPNGGTIVAS